MNNDKEKKTLAHRMGQFIGFVISLCISALIISITIALIMRLF